jgi:antitoxin (DNA-binding transcriptional repressor) of toxin-antitoxin stability system
VTAHPQEAKMTLVTVSEARENLPELLRRVAAGERIVITDGEKWVAALGAPPPPPPTDEEIAAQQRLAEEKVRETMMMWLAEEPDHPNRETYQRWLDEHPR